MKIAMFLNGPIKNDSRVKKTINSLSKKLDVYLFYINGSVEDAAFFADNVNLYSINAKDKKLAWVFRHSLFFLEFYYLAKKAVSLDIVFDYVWANDLPTCYPAYQLVKKQKARFIYDSHEIFLETLHQFYLKSDSFVKNSLFSLSLFIMKLSGEWYERIMFKKLDFFITVNESLKDYYIKKHAILAANCSVIMNCPTLSFSQQMLDNKVYENTNWTKEDKILLYQGVLNEGRGLMLLLQTFTTLPERFKLVVIGDGILMKTMRSFVEEKGLESRVKFLGLIREEDFMHYTPYADIGFNILESVNLSKAMASPNKLFQYIHSEIPSVNSNTIENIRVLEHFAIGITAENMEESIAQAILELEEGSLDKKVFSEAKRFYSWEKQEEILLNLFK